MSPTVSFSTPLTMANRTSINCYFRSLQMTYNTPPSRLNLNSPYQTNTKEELDMRRKAEVLKHQGPQKSTQMNTLTKKQKFAQVIRGYNPEQKALTSNRFTLEQLNYCDSSNNKTLSSSSDVPGKPVLLYMDRTIPLYNYANQYQTFSNIPKPPGELLPWRFFSNEQATRLEETEINIGTLQILKDIPSAVSTFLINIPGNNIPADTSGNLVLIVKYATQEIAYINDSFTYVTIPSNITISNINLYTVDGYFYEFFVKLKNNASSTSLTIQGDYVTLSQYGILSDS